MIEGPGGASASSRPPLRRFSPEGLVEQLRAQAQRLWRWMVPATASRASTDGLLWRLRLAERIGWMVLAALGLYLVSDLLFVHRRPPMTAVQPSQAPSLSHATESARSEDGLKPAAEYQQAIVTRNPFRLALPDSVQARSVKLKLTELTSTLSVVGINRGRVPEALVEDSAAKRTYFVKVGEQINGLTVKSIDQRGVTVTYENEEAILP